MTGTSLCLSSRMASLSMLRMIGHPATPQNTLTHHSVTLSYSHTIVAKWTQTAYSHSYTHIHLCQNEHTPLGQIWHPPPVVTSLQPPPPSMGAIPVTVGCVRCVKVLKSCRLFPVNLVSLLYVVVQMFWEEVCRCRRMARHNTSQRAAVGGGWSTPQEVHTCQHAGHRARLLRVTVCLNHFHNF